MFRYARPSMKAPDKFFEIKEDVSVIIEAFSKYTTQFTAQTCKDMKKFFESYPFINLKRVKY